MFSSYNPPCGNQNVSLSLKSCTVFSCWYKHEEYKGWERGLLYEIQQSDSQGCPCTFMSLRDDRLAWMTYCPASQWKTTEQESTILTLCPFPVISGKEWLRGVRDLSEPSWITQACLYDRYSQWMQLIGASFWPVKSIIPSKKTKAILQWFV